MGKKKKTMVRAGKKKHGSPAKPKRIVKRSAVKKAPPSAARRSKLPQSDKNYQERYERLSRIVEAVAASVSDYVYVLDRQGCLIFANRPLLNLWGLKLEQAVGKNFFDLKYPHTLAAKLQAQIQRVIKTKKSIADEAEYVAESGKAGYYEYVFNPVFAADGSVEVVAGSTRDISERRQADKQRTVVTDEIQRLSRIYETILSNTDDFAYIFDPQARFLYANRRLLTVWDKTLDEVIGKDCLELGYPDWHAEMHGREVAQVVATKKSVRGEVPFTGDSGITGVYDYIFTPVLGANGEVEVIVGTTREISERKRAEEALRNAQDELRKRAEELESKVSERTAKLTETVGDLESFSYSIVHDMRAPLRSMQGYATLLVEEHKFQLPKEALTYLERISNSAHRMDQLIQDVLSFSRVARADLELVPIDADALLRDILETYPDLRAKKDHIAIEGTLPVVMGNEAALTQCFSNLIGNALKFTITGKDANIRVWAELMGAQSRIFVEDDGIGIPQHLHARIFELFQRANRTHEGTGIGLPIVKKSVERMGGKVGMSSFPGQGSVFWLELNLANP